MTRWEVTLMAPGLVAPAPVRVEADYMTFTSGCAVFRIQGSSTDYPKTVAVFPVHAFQSIKRLDDA